MAMHAGHVLTAAERRWLGMVAELSLDLGAQTTGYPPMYTGWYFDLFIDRQADGMRNASKGSRLEDVGRRMISSG